MRLPRLSAPIRKALACVGAGCLLVLLQCCVWLYHQWHGREVWMWIDCANSPQVAQALAMGCDPNVRGAQGFPALCTAAAVGSVETTEMLLRSGAKPDLTTPDGDTPLMFAARFTNAPGRGDSGRYVSIINALIEHHASVNQRNRKGETALTLACRSGSLENVRSLVEHGAQINITDSENTSLLQIASSLHYFDIVTFLQQYGVK